MKKLTQKRLKELLHYDPDTGIFTRKITTAPNAIKGAIVGCRDKKYKYLRTYIDGKLYLNHRLIWLYMEGYFPENEIDHINQIKTDNRWKNLRETSHSCNLKNTNNPKNNTTGVKGIVWEKRKQKWQAQMHIKGKSKFLGYYQNFDNAVCARLAGEQCLNWNGCNNNSPAYLYVQRMLKKRKLPKIIV